MLYQGYSIEQINKIGRLWNMDQALKQEDIPSGGIADFIYSDEEIKLLEEKELQDLYGQNGIAQFKAIGKEMANFGRYGDDTVAHVETGEPHRPTSLDREQPQVKKKAYLVTCVSLA